MRWKSFLCGYLPIITTSFTVAGKSQSISSFCGTYAMRLCVLSMLLSSMVMLPALGSIRPNMDLNKVDLPAPFGPIRPYVFPRSILRKMLDSTRFLSYETDNPFMSMMGAFTFYLFIKRAVTNNPAISAPINNPMSCELYPSPSSGMISSKSFDSADTMVLVLYLIIST